MKHLVEANRKAVESKNWYGALTLALTLPDICGKIKNPKKRSLKRYANWFDSYVAHRYTVENEIWLSGTDCYALRCAFLHQGEFDLKGQSAKRRVDSFVIIPPPIDGGVCHRNINVVRGHVKMQIQVDIFAYDTCDGVEAWIEENKKNDTVIEKINNLGLIASSPNGNLPF